jgi:hypothetical protein
MKIHKIAAFSLLWISCLSATGKDKKKALLPADVLNARTVLVVIDPESGIALDAPTANRTAQEDVEKALMKWGRFDLAMDVSTADLVISVRRGNGKVVQPTVGGVPTNNRPVIFEPADSGGRIGGHTGNPPPIGDSPESPSNGPSPQVEVGPAQDMFVVYRGNRQSQGNPLDSPAVWRYIAKDALRSPDVPAVDVFRKLIAESEKQLAPKP